MSTKRQADPFFIAAIGILLFGLVIAGFQIKGAIECGNKGGAYLVPSNGFPVCVAGVK